MSLTRSDGTLQKLASDIRACRICVETPLGLPLPHQPNPVFHASGKAKVIVAGQAPGARVHASGVPFTDRSGDRLRAWMGVTSDQFYNLELISIIPMGFCFPGNDKHGGDLPPRRECRAIWHDQVFASIQHPLLLLCVGQYALNYHLQRLGLGQLIGPNLTQTVANWREIRATAPYPVIPLPHPSWRNTAWLKRNTWFEKELLPVLQQDIAAALHR